MTELRVIKEESASDDALQQRINEGFKIWRKNVPYLYDMLLSHALAWPSLTVQWFPDAARDEATETTTQRLLLSTHTSGKDMEYLQIVGVTLPDKVTDAEERALEDGGYGFGDSKLKILQKIPTVHEINRARYMPAMCSLIATRFDIPETYLYDYTKHPSFPKDAVPDHILRGHERGGYGIAWNPVSAAELLTSGDDGLVCRYDLNTPREEPSETLRFSKGVNDVAFNCTGEIFAGACDGREIIVVDPRIQGGDRLALHQGHTSDIFCAHFSLADPLVLATGAKDGTVCVWDLRDMRGPRHVLSGHEGEILQVQWSPHFGNVLASAGTDRRVYVWDLDRVGMEQTKEDAEDGPPELLFVHGGHTNSVCDVSWNPHEPWEVASVADDNVVQIWQLSSEIAPDEDDQE